MNSWDRTAYISDVKYGRPSYEAQMNSVDHNFSAPSSIGPVMCSNPWLI